MKLVFLDFDGVLNSTGPRKDKFITFMNDHHLTWFLHFIHYDPLLVNRRYLRRLRKICIKSKAFVVVSATSRGTWLYDGSYIQSPRKRRIRNLLKYYHIRILGKTPALANKNRGDEIQAYLDKYKYYPGIIESFVILDDDVEDIIDKFPNNIIHTERLLKKTDPYKTSGLSRQDVNDALKILNKKERGKRK